MVFVPSRLRTNKKSRHSEAFYSDDVSAECQPLTWKPRQKHGFQPQQPRLLMKKKMMPLFEFSSKLPFLFRRTRGSAGVRARGPNRFTDGLKEEDAEPGPGPAVLAVYAEPGSTIGSREVSGGQTMCCLVVSVAMVTVWSVAGAGDKWTGDAVNLIVSRDVNMESVSDQIDANVTQDTPARPVTKGWGSKVNPTDLNECGLKPRPCKHRCMNTLGSYKCYCLDGYTLQADGSCRNTRTCYHANCQYGCEVIKGLVRCTCPSPGLQLGPDRRTCVDINECISGGGGCPHRRKCVNTFGSFVCKCHLGFKLTYINGRYTCIGHSVVLLTESNFSKVQV
ncbi:hypothetical protein Q8A73_012596 [Channa argus]|nr:hypothetical protein Q8A73_012596 [Channa argus]